MKRIFSALFAVFSIFATTLTVCAARISLSVDPSVAIVSNRVEATVLVRNNGDEEAHQVLVRAKLGEKFVLSRTVGALEPGAEHRFKLGFGDSQPGDGVSPVVQFSEGPSANLDFDNKRLGGH